MPSKKNLKTTPGWVSAFQTISNEPRVKDFIRFSSGVFKEVEPFLKQPNWWNATRAATGVMKIYLDEYEIWPDSFFESGDWKRVYDYPFSSIVLSALHEAGGPLPTVIKTIDGPNIIRIHEFETFKVGYSYNTKLQQSAGDIYMEGDVDAAKLMITTMTWQRLDTNAALYKTSKRDDKPGSNFQADNSAAPLDSARAREYAGFMKRYIDAGIHRSVMLYGPPGTGKSTMARAIVSYLGYRSLRVRVEDIQYMDNSQVTEIFGILNPDVIILDDFDRAGHQASLLETLEHFTRNVKLIIATVNDRRALDDAILRPGRFDEMVLVNKMEDNVIRFMLGVECQDAFEIVKDWPIAFINEYVKRRKIFTKEEAESSLIELILRVAELEKSANKRNVDDLEANFMEKISKEKAAKDKAAGIVNEEDYPDDDDDGEGDSDPLDEDLVDSVAEQD